MVGLLLACATALNPIALKAFSTSTSNWKFLRPPSGKVFLVLMSNRAKTGPVTKTSRGAQSPRTTWRQSGPFAGARYLPVGAAAAYQVGDVALTLNARMVLSMVSCGSI